MITGFNTDVPYGGVTYHVQTEDKGLDSPLILSLVYVGGAIIASKRTPYEDLISKGFDEKVLTERLQRQHKLIIAAIKNGRVEDLKRMGGAGGAAPGPEPEPQAGGVAAAAPAAKVSGGQRRKKSEPTPPPATVPPAAPAEETPSSPAQAAPPRPAEEAPSRAADSAASRQAQEVITLPAPAAPPPTHAPKTRPGQEAKPPQEARPAPAATTAPAPSPAPAAAEDDAPIFVEPLLVEPLPEEDVPARGRASQSEPEIVILTTLADEINALGGLPPRPFQKPPEPPPAPPVVEVVPAAPAPLLTAEVLEAAHQDSDEIYMTLLDDEGDFRAGQLATVKVYVGRGAYGRRPEPDASVTVKVLGTSFRPLILTATTDAQGVGVVRALLPRFTSGRAAIIIRASKGDEAAELRRIIHQ
ncbi:MAG TPA: hypothetical protein VF668_22180 [Pyrinomonadaceae bacterium]